MLPGLLEQQQQQWVTPVWRAQLLVLVLLVPPGGHSHPLPWAEAHQLLVPPDLLLLLLLVPLLLALTDSGQRQQQQQPVTVLLLLPATDQP